MNEKQLFKTLNAIINTIQEIYRTLEDDGYCSVEWVWTALEEAKKELRVLENEN